MRTLITTIQTHLQDDSDLAHIDDSNIIIVIDPTILPETLTFPAIGIKDGDIDYDFEEGENWQRELYVHFFIYQLLTSDDKCITGLGTGSDPHGILKLSDDLHNSLCDNKLSIPGMEVALPYSEKESVIMGDEDILMIRKDITYRYQHLENLPT